MKGVLNFKCFNKDRLMIEIACAVNYSFPLVLVLFNTGCSKRPCLISTEESEKSIF